MKPRLAGLLVALALVACQGGRPVASPPAPAAPVMTPTASPAPTAGPPAATVNFKPPEVVASGLVVPWSIAFGNDGSAWVTERTGAVRVIRNGQLVAQPAVTLNVSQGAGIESGLLGIALKLPKVYLYYTYLNGSGAKVNRVSEFTADGDHLGGERVVLDGIPGGTCCHFGGRLSFGPDGALYAAVGDGQVPSRAASAEGLNGRVLKLDLSGGSTTYAFGLRNPEGLAWAPDGTLWATDNGPTGEFGIPTGHDEVDHLVPGGNFGWPQFAGNTTTGASGAANPVAPVIESGTATWAPSGASFYSPDYRTEQPALFFASLKSEALYRLYNGQLQTVMSGYGRLRDVERNPADGCLYVLTSNRDGRGSPRSGDDKVLRLCPA